MLISMAWNVLPARLTSFKFQPDVRKPILTSRMKKSVSYASRFFLGTLVLVLNLGHSHAQTPLELQPAGELLNQSEEGTRKNEDSYRNENSYRNEDSDKNVQSH